MKKPVLILFLLLTFLTVKSQISKSVTIVGGGLSVALTVTEKATVTNLIVLGSVDARDFKTMRDSMPVLESVNLVDTYIVPYTGTNGPISPTNYSYSANEVPVYAFCNPNTFVGKATLKIIGLPSNTTVIGENAFYNCHGLTWVTNMESALIINSFAFSFSGNGLNITIPSTVTTINNFAFEAINGSITVDPANKYYSSQDGVLFDSKKEKLINCPASKTGSYVIPSTVRTIEMNAFSHCNNFSGTFRIPLGVTTLGSWAFRNCESISRMIIPASVNSIGTGAFSECKGLTSIYTYAPVPVDLSATTMVFYLIDKTNCTLHVPYSTQSLYQSANQWQDFNNIEEMSDSCLAIDDYPYEEDFSKGKPYCWSIIDNQGNGQVWVFNNPGNRDDIQTTTHENGFAIIDSKYYGPGNSQDCDLVTSTFDFTYFTNIEVSFSHYFKTQNPSSGYFSYSTDGGINWTKIYEWYGSTNPENFSTYYFPDVAAQLEGKKNVKFKWNYTTSSWSNYWAVDDFKITAERIPVAEDITVSDTTVNNSLSACFDAINSITIAGDGSTVLVEDGAAADFIAGQSVQFLPGFHAYNGSQMHAWITTDGTFCEGLPAPVATLPEPKSSEVAEAVEPQNLVGSGKSFKVYPNPTTGVLFIELHNFNPNTSIAIYNLSGVKVYATNCISSTLKVNIEHLKKGIYLLQVTDEKTFKMKKIQLL
jgi:hypothetical protein